MQPLLHLILSLRLMLGRAVHLAGHGLPRVLLMCVRRLAALLVLLQCDVAKAKTLQV